MRKTTILLSILVLAAMVLAACGAEETTTPIATVPPITAEATDDMTVTDVPTDAATMEPTEEAGVPVTGEINPARVSNQMDFPVLSEDGQQIGEVDDMILDLDSRSVAYVIVTATGGSTVAVPWDSLTLQTGAGTSTDGTGTDQSTSTPEVGTGQETATPGTDTAGTGTATTEPAATEPAATADAGTGVTSGQFAFILQGDPEMLNSAPAFDPTTLPEMGEAAGDWDADIDSFWQGGAMPADSNTPSADSTLPAPDGTTVPEGTATGDAGTGTGQATATQEAGAAGTDTGAQGTTTLQGVVLASEVLGSTVTLSPGQGQGPTENQGQATADPNATVDPNATATTESAGQGQDQGQGVGNIEATIEDMIVDTDTGDIQYFVLNTTLEDGERWAPVPLGLMQWDATSGAFLLNVNPSVFRDAPFFEDGQFPDTSMEGWNSEFDSFWQNNGAGEGSGDGSGGAEATATP